MIEDVAGGMRDGKKLKAVIPGGSSCPLLTADEIDITMDFDSVAKAGSMLGSGGLVVIDEDTCMVDLARRIMHFYAHESCGWCIPCREGTAWLRKMLDRFHAGGGRPEDIPLDRRAGEKHAGQDVLPAGRRRGDAHHQHREEMAARIRRASFRQVSVQAGRRFGWWLAERYRTTKWQISKEITLKIDDRERHRPAGTLVIEAARRMGIEVPSFCYYPGLSLQAACRMCLVEVEKAPKLQTACTLVAMPKAWWCAPTRRKCTKRARACWNFCSPIIRSIARCATRAANANCRTWFSATARTTAASSKKSCTMPEEKWSEAGLLRRAALHSVLPLRARVRRRHGRQSARRRRSAASHSVIIPNGGDHLDCEECGMCIDICPVGALTSGTYRYKTRPWEMKYVSTVCTHCSNGCKTTLSVRNNEILRANNRDLSGFNNDFLCVQGPLRI